MARAEQAMARRSGCTRDYTQLAEGPSHRLGWYDGSVDDTPEAPQYRAKRAAIQHVVDQQHHRASWPCESHGGERHQPVRDHHVKTGLSGGASDPASRARRPHQRPRRGEQPWALRQLQVGDRYHGDVPSMEPFREASVGYRSNNMPVAAVLGRFEQPLEHQLGTTDEASGIDREHPKGRPLIPFFAHSVSKATHVVFGLVAPRRCRARTRMCHRAHPDESPPNAR